MANKSSTKKPIRKNAKQNSTHQVEESFPIVGVGASAGGLEAYTQFLKNLPADTDMAFVLVQHQDPTHQSSLPELLTKATKMPVREAQEGMVVQPNHVYVIPPNTSMTIIRGALRLNPRQAGRGPHLPVDSFFISLAEYRKNNAIGVILSGTASDGTLGLKAIKAADGITFAQDEQSAKYDGMPRSAIAAGVVDFILPPEEIAKQIASIGKHPLVKLRKAESELIPEGDTNLHTIFSIIRKTTGVDFTHYKPTTIMRRISRRMLLQKSHTLELYARFLKSNPKEVNALYEDILINVTSFFRDPETFEILKREIFPNLLKKSSEKVIRVWVPGCSTGEEAYSLAITLMESLGEKSAGMQIQIFATDISENAINKARTGIYPADITENISPDRLRRFFTKNDQGYQINKGIRDLCIFAKHNLAKDPPFSKIDLISCRNLLIYLSPILQRKVVPLFHYALNPNGYLLLGNTETIGSFSEFFYPADRKYRVFAKKSIPTKLHFEAEHFLGGPGPAVVVNQKNSLVLTERDIMKEGDRLLLSRFAPASVIVNEDLQILHFRGRTGLFLEPSPGQASLNLLKMAREGLTVELRSALNRVKKENVAVRTEGLRVRINGNTRDLAIEVIPMKLAQSSDRFYLVMFESLEEQSRELKKKKAPAAGKRADALWSLNQELNATKEYLQSIIEEQEATNEELRAANEEILSSNEELQSTNEEMETAKEELQSANEELTTVNEELQNRNIELNLVNNDLNNLLASVNIPIMMLGPDLRIRRFTPASERILNLIHTDIGRPISDINMNINTTNLEELIVEALEQVQIKETDLQDRRGKWYNMQIRPYKTMDNRIDGAVLVFIDIDAMKRSLGKVQEYQTLCAAMVEALEQPLVLLSDTLKVRLANQSFYNFFNVSKEETENKFFFELGNGQWAIPELKTLLERVVDKRSRVRNYILDKNLPKIGKKKILVNALPIKIEDLEEQFIIVSMDDLSNLTKSNKAL
jgi:two-component system CheB/CheR fusion protein